MLPSYKATLWPEPLGGCLGIEFVYMTHVNDTCRSHNNVMVDLASFHKFSWNTP